MKPDEKVRCAEVVKLRLEGMELGEIAARVGLAGKSSAHYHVTEWCVAVHDDRRHFEMLILEGAPAEPGLSLCPKNSEQKQTRPPRVRSADAPQ